MFYGASIVEQSWNAYDEYDDELSSDVLCERRSILMLAPGVDARTSKTFITFKRFLSSRTFMILANRLDVANYVDVLCRVIFLLDVLCRVDRRALI